VHEFKFYRKVMLEVRVIYIYIYIYIYTIVTSNSLIRYHPRALRTKHNPYRNQHNFAKYFVGQILY
jgi:hypothetical protein